MIIENAALIGLVNGLDQEYRGQLKCHMVQCEEKEHLFCIQKLGNFGILYIAFDNLLSKKSMGLTIMDNKPIEGPFYIEDEGEWVHALVRVDGMMSSTLIELRAEELAGEMILTDYCAEFSKGMWNFLDYRTWFAFNMARELKTKELLLGKEYLTQREMELLSTARLFSMFENELSLGQEKDQDTIKRLRNFTTRIVEASSVYQFGSREEEEFFFNIRELFKKIGSEKGYTVKGLNMYAHLGKNLISVFSIRAYGGRIALWDDVFGCRNQEGELTFNGIKPENLTALDGSKYTGQLFKNGELGIISGTKELERILDKRIETIKCLYCDRVKQ